MVHEKDKYVRNQRRTLVALLADLIRVALDGVGGGLVSAGSGVGGRVG